MTRVFAFMLMLVLMIMILIAIVIVIWSSAIIRLRFLRRDRQTAATAEPAWDDKVFEVAMGWARPKFSGRTKTISRRNQFMNRSLFTFTVFGLALASVCSADETPAPSPSPTAAVAMTPAGAGGAANAQQMQNRMRQYQQMKNMRAVTEQERAARAAHMAAEKPAGQATGVAAAVPTNGAAVINHADNVTKEAEKTVSDADKALAAKTSPSPSQPPTPLVKPSASVAASPSP
jgi:hypothetical protein